MSSSARVEGGADCRRALVALPEGLKKKHLRGAITAGTAPILKAAKAKAPKRYGLLKRAMARKTKSYKNGNVAGIVGANRNAQPTAKQVQKFGKAVAGIKPSRYLHLVEKGTKAHESPDPNSKQVIHHPGAKAQPFLLASYVSQRHAAKAAMEAKIADGIAKEAARRS